MTSHIAVVGGGIAGLAAALRLRERAPSGTEIIVYEQSDTPGGKLLTGSVGGIRVELGAEAFLTRDPAGGDSAAVELARRVGLADALVHPSEARAAIAVDGALHPLPEGTLIGVPGDLDALPPVAHAVPGRDVDRGHPLLGPDEDISVGALVRSRFGDEVVDRLVEPMLGGVYGGRPDELSLVVTMPGLARACRTAHTLTGAVRMLIGGPRPPGAASGPGGAGPVGGPAPGPARGPVAPMFTTVDGGMGRLVEALAAAVAAAGDPPGAGAGDPLRSHLELGQPVRELHRAGARWRLVLGPANRPRAVQADAVVLALPSRPAARLLEGLHAEAAAAVGVLDYASIALVTMVLPEQRLPELSGILVPATEHTAIKAATFFTTKWSHLRRPDGLALVRVSLGRHGEEHLLQRPDDDLVTTAHTELSRLVGRSLPVPTAAHVRRWGDSLPQYQPGHADRVATARAALADRYPTLALAGAGYDGVGIPICIRSGQTAADHVLKALGDRCD